MSTIHSVDRRVSFVFVCLKKYDKITQWVSITDGSIPGYNHLILSFVYMLRDLSGLKENLGASDWELV